MRKIRNSNVLKELVDFRTANAAIQDNKETLDLERAAKAIPTFTGDNENPLDYDNLTEDQINLLQVFPEDTIQQSKDDYLNLIEKERKEEERSKFLEEQDRAFEKEDTDFFQDEIATTSKAAADEALRQTVLVDNELQKSVKTMFPGIPGMDFKMLNLFGYNFTAGIDDTGAFITAPASFRFPTSKNLFNNENSLETDLAIAASSGNGANAIGILADRVFQSYNKYMDENKAKNLTEIESLNNFEKLLGLLQDNSISKGFVDAAKENRAIGETYKLQNKSIANDGFGVLKDPKYWADLVFSGAGSLIPYLLGGSAVAKAGTRIGLSTTANTLSTAALMNNMETAQIATDVASKVFTQTLDKHTDGAFTAGQNNYVNQEMQKQMAFLKEHGKDVSEQELVKFELELKDQYLKQFVEANPEETKKAHQAAVKGFSQAAAVNSLNFVTNLTGANLLVGGIKRELLKKPLKQLASAGFREAAQEAIEEGGGNYIAEKSGIARGMNAKYGSSELLDDLISLEAFEQALAGATLGFMSGSAIVSSNYSNIKDSYQKQQAVLEKYNSIADKNIVDQDLLLTTAATLSRNEKVKELLQQHTIAKTTGDAIAQTAIEDIIIAEQTTDAVSNGTLPSLLAMYNKIATNNSNSTQTKTKALEIINDINATAKLVEDNINLKNVGEVVHKEVLLRSNDKQKILINNDKSATVAKLIEHAKTFKSPKKGIEIDSDSIAIDIENVLNNPYTNPYEGRPTQKKLYNDFLKSAETANLLAELDQHNLYLDSLDKSSTQTREQLGILKSKKHQKKLEAKEKLALKLKSIKKTVLDDTIRKASKEDNALFEKLVDDLKPTTKEEYNRGIDKIANSFSKKNQIPYYELEALKNVFKLTNALAPSQVSDIQDQAINALVEEATNEKANELIEQEDTIPDSTGIAETIETQESVGITINNDVQESVGIESVQTEEEQTSQEISTIDEMLKQDPTLIPLIEQTIELNKLKLNKLAEQAVQIEKEIEIYEAQVLDALTDESKKVLLEVLDKTKNTLEKNNQDIIDTNKTLSKFQDLLYNNSSNHIDVQDRQLMEVLNDAIIETGRPVDSGLTEEQITEINNKSARLGGNQLQVDSIIATDNSTPTVDNPVIATTFEQTSIIRTKKAPLLGNYLVSSKTNLANEIKESFERFIYELDDPSITALNRIVSYEIDKTMISVFGLSRQENSNKYPGIQAVMAFLNNGVTYTEQQLNDPNNKLGYLSDELVLALEVKVKLDNYNYTYLVDDGYFRLENLIYDEVGNVVLEDGRKMTNTEFNKYKQFVINEKRQILSKILSGQNPQSRIIKQDYGSLARKDDVYNNVDQILDFNSKVHKFYIIKENNEIDGGPITDLTDIKSNSLNPGTLAIGTVAPTGNIILEGLKANNLTLQESKLLLEAAKIIIDNPAQAVIPTDITVDGVLVSSGIAPLVIFDLISNLVTINKGTKDKTNRLESSEFKVALNEVSRALEESDEKALKYFTAKFRKSSKEGINKSIKDTIDTFNKLSGISRIETPYTDNAIILGININDEFGYNQFVATGHSTNATKLARTNSGIVAQLIQVDEVVFNTIEETPSYLPRTDVIDNAEDQFLKEYDGNPDDTAFSTISSATELVRDETLLEQVEWLQENLPQFPTEEYNYILPLVNDKIALGYFVTGLEGLIGEDSNFGIRFSSFQPKNDRERGIIYHEAFHAVARALISEKEYTDLLKIDTEENLAEAFRLYIRFGEPYNSKKVLNLFDRVIKYILNFLNLNNDAKINRLFSDIATGKYKYAPIRTERITKFGTAYSTTNAGITSLIAKEFAKSVVMMALDNTNLEVIEKITNKHVKDTIYLAIGHHKQNPDTEAAATFNKFLTNYNTLTAAENDAAKLLEPGQTLPDNILVVEANKYLKNIVKSDLKEQAENNIGQVDLDNNEIETNDESTSDISAHTVDTNIINYNLKSPKFVRVLLASIPKLDNNGNFVYNKHTGLRDAVNYNSLYTALLEYLQGSFNDIIVNDTTIMTDSNLAKYKVLENLKELAQFKPELRQLYTYLTKLNTSITDTAQQIEAKKTVLSKRQGLFYAAMALNKESYLSVTYRPKDTDDNTDYSLTVWESGNSGPSSELVQKWHGKADWESKLLSVSDDGIVTFNKDAIDEISNATIKLDNELSGKDGYKIKATNKTKSVTQEQLNEYYNKSTDLIINYLDTQLGVKVNRNALDLYVYSKGKNNKFINVFIDNNNNKNYTTQALIDLIGIYEHVSKRFRNPKDANSFKYRSIIDAKKISLKEIYNEFKNSFIDIAKYQYLFEDHIGAATIKGPDNKPIFLFDFQSHIQNMVNFMQSNTPASNAYMQKLHSKVEHNHSYYSQYLQNKKITLSRLLVKTDKRDQEDRGVNGISISLKDDLVLNINLTLNSLLSPQHFKSYIRTLSFADKGTSDIYYAVPNEMVRLPIASFNTDGSINKIDDGTKGIFYNYLLSELERVTYTGNILNKNLKKNKLEIYSFPAFTPKGDNLINNEVAVFIKELVDKKEPNQDLRAVMTAFRDSNGKDILYHIEQELISSINSEFTQYEKNLVTLKDINSDVVTKFNQKYGDTNSLKALVATTFINSSVAFIETTKLFTGSQASFKNSPDFSKRTPAIITKGYQYALENTEDTKFNLAVIKTNLKTSNIYNRELIETFRPLLENKVQEFIKEKKLNKTLADFTTQIDNELDNLHAAYNKKVDDKSGEEKNQLDTTDAQGYITLDRWYKLVKGLHKSSVKVDQLYQKLKNSTATYDDFYDAQTFLQPLKGVLSELYINNTDFTTPVYIKYSQFILTPQLVATSKGLTDLYNKMIAENIDEVVFDTASKGDFLETGFITQPFSKLPLNTSSWKLQVDFTAKDYKGTKNLVGTQFIKNIVSNIRFENMYTPDLTGRQLIQNIHSILATLNFKKAENFYKNNDLLKFALNLESLTDVQRDALGTTPITAMPQILSALEASYNSAIKKNITEVQMNGGAFIQASNEFFTDGIDVNNTHIRWLLEADEKKELTGSTPLKSAYILIPYNIAKGLTDEQLKTLTFDSKALDGVAYRIPNQPKASIDKVRIAGILPRGYGDTIIVYDETTKKFGSDFDVDKTYVVLPDIKYDKTRNHINYVQPPNNNNYGNWSFGELNNQLLDYWKLLLDNHLDEPVTPLDSNDLETKVIESGAELTPKTGLNFTGNSSQLNIKRNNTLAKELIGPFANLTSDIALNQYAGIYIPYKLGIGNKTADGFIDLSQKFDMFGNYITDNAKEYQNASVDAAKNPFIIAGNINNNTISTVVLLLKAGLDNRFIVDFTFTPILVKYSILLDNGSTHAEAVKQLAGQHFDYYKNTELSTLALEVEKDIRKPRVDGIKNVLNSDMVLALFDKLKNLADIDTKQTLATKGDVDGFGKTMVDKFTLQEKLRSIMKITPREMELFNELFYTKKLTYDNLQIFNGNSDVKNFIFKFIDSSTTPKDQVNRLTPLGMHYKTAILMMQDNNIDSFPVFSKKFRDYATQMSNQLGENFLTNKATVKILYDAFYNYLTKKSILLAPKSDLRSKLMSATGLAKELKELMNSNPDFEANPFINQLLFNTDPVQKYTFINVDNRRIKDNKNEIIIGWQQILDGEYGDAAKEIGYKLIEYSLQSGTTYNFKSFFHFIPPSVFKSRALDINRIFDTQDSINELVDQTFRNNYTNEAIVSKVSTKVEFKDNLMYIDDIYKLKKNGVISPFVTTNPKNSVTQLRSKKLYQLDSIIDNGDGSLRYAYKLTNTLGYSSEYGIVNEYGTTASITLNQQSKIRNIERINTQFINNIAEFRLPLRPINENIFKGKLIYAMPGSGKTELSLVNIDVFEPEPYYKELLKNNSIKEGQLAIVTDPITKTLDWTKIEPIRQLVADRVINELNNGKIVVSGLTFLAKGADKYGLKYDNAVVLKDVALLEERTSKRKENPIVDENFEDLYKKSLRLALDLKTNLVSLSENNYLSDFIYNKLPKVTPTNTNSTDETKSNCP